MKDLFYQAAIRGADWLERTQNKDWNDANRGRFLGTYVPATGEKSFSIGWPTGTSIMGLLLAYHRTKDEKYLEAAIRAGDYLKSLQILDHRYPDQFGCFREETPQTTWAYPRDGLTASWALLWLYEQTHDEEYLYRVKLFNNWFLSHVMKDRWPYWEVNFRGEPYKNSNLHGSFHGGDGAYFFDYYRVTGDDSHLERGLRFICDYLLKVFMQPNGDYRIIYDAEKKDYLDGEDSPMYPLAWQIMHRYNDDFSTISLLDAFLYYKDKKYLERTESFAQWLLSEQQPSGGYGNPPIPPASATVPMLFIDLHRITHNPVYLESAYKAGQHLLSLQLNCPDDPMADGAFYGYGNGPRDVLDTINLRTASYAVIALFKLEGVVTGPYYSAFDREGNMSYR